MENINLRMMEKRTAATVDETDSPRLDRYRDAVDTDDDGALTEVEDQSVKSLEEPTISSASHGGAMRQLSLLSSAREESDDTSAAYPIGTHKVGPRSKRGKGRAVNTSDFNRLQANRAKRQAEIDLRRDIDIDDPTVAPVRSQKPKGPFEEDYVRDFQSDSLLQFTKRASEQVNRMEKMAQYASNLRGQDIRRLREAARILGASIRVLVHRAEAAKEESAAEQELDILRRELSSLNQENVRLRAEVKVSQEKEREAREKAERATMDVRAAPSMRTLEVAAAGLGSVGGLADEDEPPPPPPHPLFVAGSGDREAMPPPPAPMPTSAAHPPQGRRKKGGTGCRAGGMGGPLPVRESPLYSAASGGEGDGHLARLSREVDRLVREIRALGGAPRKEAGRPPGRQRSVSSSGTDRRPTGGKKNRKQKATPIPVASEPPPLIEGGVKRGKRGEEVAPPGGRKGPPSGGLPVDEPPRPTAELWTEVVKKGKKKREGPPQRSGDPLPSGSGPARAAGKTKEPPPARRLPRAPRTAAVILTCPPGGYAEVMREARARVKLAEVGITSLTTTRAITGALHFGVSGEKREARADALASRLREVFTGRVGVTISRPVKMAELRLSGLEDSITTAEVAAALAKAGGCSAEAIKVGAINTAPGGLCSAWVRCPAQAACKVVGAGRLTVEWCNVRVQLLEQRPLQCFKCLEGGHVRARCPNREDRSGRCYRCGGTDHIARGCTGAIKCPLCTDLGLPAGHRTGGQACRPARRGRGRVQPSRAGSAADKTALPASGDKGSPKGPLPSTSTTAQSSGSKKGDRKRAREVTTSPGTVAEEGSRAGAKARLAGDEEVSLPRRQLRSQKPVTRAESVTRPTPMETRPEDLASDSQ